MATVTPIIRRSKKDNSGRCPIWLRISDRDRTKFFSLGVKVLPSEWNPRQGRVRKGHQNADLINQLISQRLVEAEAEIVRLKLDHAYATADDIKEAIAPGEEKDFFSYADQHILSLEKQGRIGRLRRLKATFDKFKAFAGAPLPFNRITPQLLSSFESHLLEKKNKQSTIATNLRDIKTLINRGVRDGLLEYNENPFLKVKIKQGEAPERTKLSYAEVQAIEKLDLEEDSLIWHCRNFFLFAFYCAGIRFSDLALMTQVRILSGEDNSPDRLVYRMGKTGKTQSVKITPPAKRILAHYSQEGAKDDSFVFPVLEGYDLSTPKKLHNAKSSQNALVNKYLKKIAEQAKINKPLSMHIARHSFADLARTSGWDIYDISKALQHSSIEMTQRYLAAFDSKALDARMESLFNDEK